MQLRTLPIVKKILIFCSSSIGQQIFYNGGDPGNFGTALHPGYCLYYT